jgi:hypothetical protein
MPFILSAIPWLLRNWKLALGALGVLAVVIFLWQVDRRGYQRRVNEEAQAKLVLMQERIDTVEKLNKAYTALVLKDAAAITELERKASETPKNDAACLDRAAAGRVRAIK